MGGGIARAHALCRARCPGLHDLPRWRWIHTPGHTDGDVWLVREQDRVLIAGDAFVTTEQESLYAVMAQKEEVYGPPASFWPNWTTARTSVEALAALQPAIAATGHGTALGRERVA